MLLQKKILIIHKGNRYLTGLLIQYGFGNFKILKAERLSIIQDLFLEYVESNKQAENNTEELNNYLSGFEYNLLRFIKTLFTDQEEIALILNNEDLFIRNLEIPVEKVETAFEIFENEIESLLPYTLEELQVLPSLIKFENNTAYFIGFAALNSLLESYTKIIIENGLSLRMLGVECIALASAIELLLEADYLKKNVIQMDIGYSRTIINILEKGKLSFSRTINFGFKNLIDILKKYLQEKSITEETIEEFVKKNLFQLLKGNINFSYKINNIENLQKEILEEFQYFLTEVKRTLITLNYEYYSYILLSGEGALIQNINEYIEENLNIQTKFYEIQLGEDNISPWIILIGGFLHYIKSQKQKIDFLNTPLGKTLKKGEIRLEVFLPPALITSVALIIFLISFVISILLERRQLAYYQGEIQKIAKTVPGIEDSLNPISAAKKICEEKLNYWKNILAGTKFLDIIKELEEYSPEPHVANIQFKSLRYEENQIFLELVVDNIGNVVKVQEEFQKSRLFSVVEVVRRDLIAGQKVRLELSLKIKPNAIKFEVDCK